MDSSICLIYGEVGHRFVEVLLSERITRVKHKGLPPIHAINSYKLSSNHLQSVSAKQIAINSYGQRANIYESKIATSKYRKLIKDFGYEKFSTLFNPNINILTHHKSHAYSVLAATPFRKSIILVADGSGSDFNSFDGEDLEATLDNVEKGFKGSERETLTVYLQDDEKLTVVYKEWSDLDKLTQRDSHRWGNTFELASKAVFKKWIHSGKIMGLAAYGEAESYSDILEYLSDKISLNKSIESKDIFNNLCENDFLFYANIAATVQKYYEDSLIVFLKELRNRFPDYENISFAGGCALNCVANTIVSEKKIFNKIFIPPYPGDSGISLGLATALRLEREKFCIKNIDYINSFLGPFINNLNDVDKEDLFDDRWDVKEFDLVKFSKLIQSGQIVGMAIGRSEVGARALGHRSIIASPFVEGVKDRLNREVKHRESFRPYGVFILENIISEYFIVNDTFFSPFMNMSPHVKPDKKELLREVLHKDGTCRLQTINKENNRQIYELLVAFSQLGLPAILINTSLNIMDEPIVESVADVKSFLLKSSIKQMRVGDFLIQK